MSLRDEALALVGREMQRQDDKWGAGLRSLRMLRLLANPPDGGRLPRTLCKLDQGAAAVARSSILNDRQENNR